MGGEKIAPPPRLRAWIFSLKSVQDVAPNCILGPSNTPQKNSQRGHLPLWPPQDGDLKQGIPPGLDKLPTPMYGLSIRKIPLRKMGIGPVPISFHVAGATNPSYATASRQTHMGSNNTRTMWPAKCWRNLPWFGCICQIGRVFQVNSLGLRTGKWYRIFILHWREWFLPFFFWYHVITPSLNKVAVNESTYMG